MSQLFSPIALRGVTLENRVMVSPMCQYQAEDGCATDWHKLHLGQFAMGGNGMVMVTFADFAMAVNSIGACFNKPRIVSWFNRKVR